MDATAAYLYPVDSGAPPDGKPQWLGGAREPRSADRFGPGLVDDRIGSIDPPTWDSSGLGGDDLAPRLRRRSVQPNCDFPLATDLERELAARRVTSRRRTEVRCLRSAPW